MPLQRHGHQSTEPDPERDSFCLGVSATTMLHNTEGTCSAPKVIPRHGLKAVTSSVSNSVHEEDAYAKNLEIAR